ncbi:MAG: Fic family protein [Flavobacteriaceae bacterium]|nr:Fic family protein [Flavobacteriaceae bacterium]
MSFSKLKFKNLIEEYIEQSRRIVNYDRYNLYAISCHSTGIEGSKLNIDEANALLEYGLTPKGKKLDDSLMVEDHHEALKDILEMSKQKNTIPLHLGDLQRLSSKILLRTVGAEEAKNGNFDVLYGKLRTVSLQAGRTVFMAPEEVPKAIDEYVKWFNEEFKTKGENIIETYKFSFKAHFNLVSIHPFRDGNGRLSRLIMNYIQRYYEIPMSVVHMEHKQDYFDALYETRKTKDINCLYNFMFDEATLFFKMR